MRSGFSEFNLLPSAFSQAVMSRRWCLLWGGLIGAAALIVVGGGVVVHLRAVGPAARLEDQIQQAAHEVARLQALEGTQTDSVLKDAGYVDPRETLPEHWGELLRGLAVMSGGEIGFELIEIEIAENHEILIQVEGLAQSSQDVLRFASTVERSGLFGSMSSPAITFDRSTGSVRFTLSAPIPAVAVVPGEGS